MKNPMKRIVPILLAIAVIACAIWYVFVYDRDFARDVLLSQARYFDSEGRPDIATWFYDQAYIFADNDEDVAIELADQYKASGNYTKAEYTLSKAISDGPSAKLYTALCKTYVEQDKLMDAVSMLDKISDPVIKAELESLRPAVPAISMAPGYYTQYLTLDITSEDGTLYVSGDGEYPSIHEDPYTEAIRLPQGETILYALAISEDGLVSPLGIYGYTIGGVIEPVIFADPAVEAQVRSDLGFGEEAVIYTNDLWTITSFTMPQDALVYSDLTGMIYLKDLTIFNAVSGELGCLASLKELESLMITGCEPSQQDLTAIASMEYLTTLTIAQCGLSNISPLVNAHGLEYLDLSYNSIGDITALSSLPALKTLYLAHNALTDLSALSSLSSLETLNVSYNSLTSIAPICANMSLTSLDVSNNLLVSLGAVNNLPNLKILNIGHNSLVDVTVLGGCTALEELDISNNSLTDISALAPLMNLRKFNCSYNAITALPDWSAAIALIKLDASYNQISDLEPLRQLMCLNILNMDYNPEISSIEPLIYCPVLVEVNLFGTKVIDVDALTEQSIIVNYNPTDVIVDIEDPEATEPEETEPEETE